MIKLFTATALTATALLCAPVTLADPVDPAPDPGPADLTTEGVSQGVLAFSDIFLPHATVVPAPPAVPIEPVTVEEPITSAQTEPVIAEEPPAAPAPKAESNLRADGSDPGEPLPGGAFLRRSPFFAPQTLAR